MAYFLLTTGYDGEHPFFGSSVGRYANRIEKGTFVLDGVTYQLTINTGENHLHGGIDNWSKVCNLSINLFIFIVRSNLAIHLSDTPFAIR